MYLHNEYYALTEHQRRSLVATNWFKALAGEPIIQIPIEDEEYHKYFKWPEPHLMMDSNRYPWPYCLLKNLKINNMENKETKQPAPQRSLMQLSDDQLSLINLLEETGGELTPEIEEMLQINKEQVNDKICAYQEVISHIDGKLSTVTGQIERLGAYVKKYNASIQCMKDSLLQAMLIYGEQDNKGIFRLEAKTEYNIVTLSSRKSESVEITDKDSLPAEYWRIPEVVPAPDKDAIKKAIKAGTVVPGTEIVEKINLVIK